MDFLWGCSIIRQRLITLFIILKRPIVETLMQMFNLCEGEAERIVSLKLPQPAYDYVLKCSHLFNLLDARGGAISVTGTHRI